MRVSRTSVCPSVVARATTFTSSVPISGATQKIRNGRLEVKERLEIRSGFERRKPTLEMEPPFDSATVTGLFEALGIEPPEMNDRPPLVVEALLELVARDPCAARLDIDKQRQLFELQDVRAEATEVKWAR